MLVLKKSPLSLNKRAYLTLTKIKEYHCSLHRVRISEQYWYKDKYYN